MLQFPRHSDDVELMYADNFPAYNKETRTLSGHFSGAQIIKAKPIELTDPPIVKTQLLLLRAFYKIKEETLSDFRQQKAIIQPYHFVGMLAVDNLIKYYCDDDPELSGEIVQRIIRFCTLYNTKFKRNAYSDKRDKFSYYVRWFHHDEIIYGLLHLWALWYIPYLQTSEQPVPSDYMQHMQNLINQPAGASEELIVNILMHYT